MGTGTQQLWHLHSVGLPTYEWAENNGHGLIGLSSILLEFRGRCLTSDLQYIALISRKEPGNAKRI